MSSINPRKSSLVDYSKVSSRPDAKQSIGTASAAAAPAPAAQPVAVARSAQMDAVIRLMTGREERTIAEKLADSNRPTWEQYKKDNHDKLNLDTLDQKQMDEYRKQLDEERDRRMAGLPTRDIDKKDKQTKRKHKKKHKRKHESSDDSSDESENSSKATSSSSDESRKHKKHKKRHKHHDKKRKSRSHHDKDEDSYKREKKNRKTY